MGSTIWHPGLKPAGRVADTGIMLDRPIGILFCSWWRVLVTALVVSVPVAVLALHAPLPTRLALELAAALFVAELATGALVNLTLRRKAKRAA
jgi:hypothetical protein